MEKQSYWSLLIFCAVLSQGVAILSDNNIEESSHLHIRKKRVIDKTRNGGISIHLSRARYIVNILSDGVSHCAGTILDADIIATTPHCVAEIPGVNYTILSGSEMRSSGTPHRILSRSEHPNFGLVLIKIFPHIDLSSGKNAKIELFHGEVIPDSYGTFSGWGCTELNFGHRSVFPLKLMQTRLPIISFNECNNRLHNHAQNDHICTFDSTFRRSPCLGDDGGPLVYDNRLLGILLHLGWPLWDYPHIFVNFNNLQMHNWVNININRLHRMH